MTRFPQISRLFPLSYQGLLLVMKAFLISKQILFESTISFAQMFIDWLIAIVWTFSTIYKRKAVFELSFAISKVVISLTIKFPHRYRKTYHNFRRCITPFSELKDD